MIIRKCKMSQTGRNSGDLDVAFQLFAQGIVWDGDLASKDGRSHLVRNGYAVRVNGYQALTGRGTFAFLTSPCVWIAAYRMWRLWGRNPFLPRPS